MRFHLPDIDPISFWFGVILTILSGWVYSVLRPAFQNIRETLQNKKASKKEIIHPFNKIEERYRLLVLQQTQGLHLAAPLFSLDEIIEPPTLLAPPPRLDPDSPFINDDIVDNTLPYIPAWPELAATYHAPTLTLAQALSGNSDIVLTGQPGMGKTVALSYLASRLARRDPEPGLSQETLPFLVNISDLALPGRKEDPIYPLIDLIVEKTSVLDQPHIPNLVHKAFEEGRALLLLDGTDELTPEGLKTVVDFIKAVKRTFPKTRMVTTASSDYLDGLVTLNFIPFAIAAWNNDQRQDFLQKWGDLWTNYVAVEAWAETNELVDPLLLNHWLNAEQICLTPLELTLKAWGAYAGDLRGPGPLDAIETHLLRITPDNAPRAALEMVALQVSLNAEPTFDLNKARQWIKSSEPPETDEHLEVISEMEEKKTGNNTIPSLSLINKIVESNLLIQNRKNKIRFIHPTFYCYLTSKAVGNNKIEPLLDQPPWIGKHLALHFLAASSDLTPHLDKLLSKLDRPLSRNLLIPARWLRDASPQTEWYGKLMAKLVEIVRQSGQPLGLRCQALCALILSGNPGVAALFRQLLEGQNDDILQLAALGSGALQDTKAIELLAALLSTQSLNVRRAVCLALVSIGTTTAMDHVASVLLHGDEILRKAAAEALANHRGEGHAMLKEAASMKEDLLVRRSSVYGLRRIGEPWAEELVDFLEAEDDQWVVRTAAMEVKESRTRPDPHIPIRLPPPSESPWIIAFAGKQGLGVTPDIPPTDLLLAALKSGTSDERLGSLSYLRMMPVEGVFGALYQAMYGGEPALREAVFQTFSEMAARGVDVPDPVQFGVGY
jgi:hypothetical protein